MKVKAFGLMTARAWLGSQKAVGDTMLASKFNLKVPSLRLYTWLLTMLYKSKLGGGDVHQASHTAVQAVIHLGDHSGASHVLHWPSSELSHLLGRLPVQQKKMNWQNLGSIESAAR